MLQDQGSGTTGVRYISRDLEYLRLPVIPDFTFLVMIHGSFQSMENSM